MIIFALKWVLLIIYVFGLIALIWSCDDTKSLTTKKLWTLILLPILVIPMFVCLVLIVLNSLFAWALLLVGIKYAHSYLYEKVNNALEDVVYKDLF